MDNKTFEEAKLNVLTFLGIALEHADSGYETRYVNEEFDVIGEIGYHIGVHINGYGASPTFKVYGNVKNTFVLNGIEYTNGRIEIYRGWDNSPLAISSANRYEEYCTNLTDSARKQFKALTNERSIQIFLELEKYFHEAYIGEMLRQMKTTLQRAKHDIEMQRLYVAP